MDSSESTGGDLFDGMVLFTPSVDPSPPPPTPPVAVPVPPAPASDAASSQSEPLDEDLFSDLTLLVPTPALNLSPAPSPSKPAPAAVSTTPTQAPARQVSRKKKRAVRIGYARDAVSVDDEPQPHLPPSSTSSSSSSSASAPLRPIFSEEVTSLPAVVSSESAAFDSNSDLAVGLRDVTESEVEIKQQESASVIGNQDQVKEEECAVEITPKSESDNSKAEMEKEEEEEEGCDSIEQKLALVRAKILKKAELAKQRALSITAKRKELSLRRRKVEDELNKALARHKELERELEEACEAEDFESAERISNSLAFVENDKNQLHLDLRSAQLDYESVESDMQGVLHLHLAAQEEAGSLLQLFAKVST